jgi:hypothetical protein
MRTGWGKRIVILIGLVIGLAIIVSLVLLLFPNQLPETITKDLGHRIGLAQLTMEFAGVMAILLAIWEFIQTQRKPKLRLLIKDKNSELTNPSIRINTSTLDERVHLHFYVENIGNRLARWVNINIENRNEHNSLYKDTEKLASGKWLDPERRVKKIHTFHGGDSFIAYSKDSKSKNGLLFLEYIGAFTFLTGKYDENTNDNNGKVFLYYSIKADGYSIFNEQLEIEIQQ